MTVRVRIALAYGPVRVLAGKVSGDAVTAAGMLLDKAKPGEILADQSLKDALGSSSTVKLTPYRKVESLTAYLVGDAPKSAMQEMLAKTMELKRPPVAPAASPPSPPAPAAAAPRVPPPAAARSIEPEASAPSGEETIMVRPRTEVELALTYGGKTQRFTRADGEVALGRAFENHISIPVRHVSRRHAKIVWQANGPVLVNLSANGCRVRFDDDGGNAQLCSESMALHGKGVIVLASVSGQSPTGDDTVKFSVGSK